MSVRYCNYACVFAGEGQALAASNLIILVHVFSKPTFKRLFLFLDARGKGLSAEDVLVMQVGSSFQRLSLPC